MSLEQFQKDVDDGVREYCDDKITHLRRLFLSVQSQHTKNFLERQIEHYKIMRRMR